MVSVKLLVRQLIKVVRRLVVKVAGLSVKNLPWLSKVSVLRLFGWTGRGWLGFLALTVVVLYPVGQAAFSEGAVAGFLFLYESVGSAAVSVVEAVAGLPGASGPDLYFWGVSWPYLSLLWTAVYNVITVIWVYRLLSWIMWFLDRDVSFSMQLFVTVSVIGTMMVLYGVYEAPGLFDVSGLVDGVSTLIEDVGGVVDGFGTGGGNESVSVNQSVNGSVNETIKK